MKKNMQRIKGVNAGGNKMGRSAVIACAGSALILGSFFLFPALDKEVGSKTEVEKQASEPAAVKIPAIELTEESSYELSFPLFNYNGKIYTLSETHIEASAGQALLGDKVGVTKDSLGEWSEEREYEEEFASTIGEQEVFTVKGYDPDFRLMTYTPADGARFYEQLNGITVVSGKEVFSKLRMEGNAIGAEYQTFSEWDSNAGQYREIRDQKAVGRFVENLNETKPFMQSTSIMPLNEKTMTDEGFREVVIHLKDGSKIQLLVLKHGFVYYNGIYFKMEEEQLRGFWSELDQ